MHVPDHLISNGVELAAGVTAGAVIASVAFDARRRGDTADDGPTLLRSPHLLAPQAATAALVFALQMVNVPVLPGTSGHLLGGALATALIGPRRALLAVAAVVVAQALLFADGGTGALGVNLWLIAILPVGVVTLVRHLVGVHAASGARWWVSVGTGAAAAPMVSAAAFAAFFAAGGNGASPGRVASAMVGTHAAIAVAEAAITLCVIGLVALAAARLPQGDTAPVWGLAGITAVGLSLAASSAPDGLERVLGDLDVAVDGTGSILSGSPLADYAVTGLDGALSSSAAGAVGLLAACALCCLLAVLSRPTPRARRAPVAP
jgi:cobalt/nickel transport system permease protein